MNDEVKEIAQFDATLEKSLEDFMESYKMVDVDQVYSNGIEFVPIFRVKQWLEYNNITNLQKENKHLSKSYADAILFNQKRCKQNKELQQRIDKAIEWIKKHITTYQKNDIAILDWDTFADPRNLLKILGGD